MSFLNEVLSCAKKIELETLPVKAREITTAIEVYRNDVFEYLKSIYIEFTKTSNITKSKYLMERGRSLNDELPNLIKTATEYAKRDGNSATENLDEVILQLEESKDSLGLLNVLIGIHFGCSMALEYRKQLQLIRAVQEITYARQLLSCITKRGNFAEIIDELVLHWKETEGLLLNELAHQFFDCIKIQKTDTSGTSSLKITSDCEVIHNTIEALVSTDHFAPLYELSRFLWSYVFVPILEGSVEVNINSMSNEDDGILLFHNLMIIKLVEQNLRKRNNCKAVYDNLSTVLQFFNEHLNYTVLEDQTVLEYIGRELSSDLYECITNCCLSESAIPDLSEDPEQYNALMESTKRLQTELLHSGFFTPETPLLISHIESTNRNRKRREYSTLALALMKKELQSTTEVELPESSNDDRLEKCGVSASCIKLLQLTEKVLEETLNRKQQQKCKNDDDILLLSAIRDAFFMYGKVVGKHHRKLLDANPRYLAVFYNNCRYIAARLLEWNKTYREVADAGCVIFRNEPHKLHTIATDSLAKYVKKVIGQVESTVVGLSDAKTELVVVEDTVRLVLGQLELLKTQWSKVLSHKIYDEILGTILSALCASLIHYTLNFDTVTPNNAEKLVKAYKLLTNEVPKLLNVPEDVTLVVETWDKFNELIFVLSAGLLDVADGWQRGKGKLHLDVEQVTRIIRTRFEQTEKRAAVLQIISSKFG